MSFTQAQLCLEVRQHHNSEGATFHRIVQPQNLNIKAIYIMEAQEDLQISQQQHHKVCLASHQARCWDDENL